MRLTPLEKVQCVPINILAMICVTPIVVIMFIVAGLFLSFILINVYTVVAFICGFKVEIAAGSLAKVMVIGSYQGSLRGATRRGAHRGTCESGRNSLVVTDPQVLTPNLIKIMHLPPPPFTIA